MNFKQLSSGQPKFKIETRTAEGVVELRWKAVKYADGYRVFSSEHGQNKFVGEVNTNDTFAKLKGRENGKALDYKVKAFRIADGPDNFFAESEIVFVCPMVTPANMRYRTDKGGRVTVMWDSSPDADGYKLYCSSSDKGDKYDFLCYCGKNSCKLPASEKEKLCSYKVRAFSVISGIEKLSNFSEPISVKLPAAAKTSAPTKIYERRKNSPSDISERFISRSETLVKNNNKCVIMLGGDMCTCPQLQAEALRAGTGFGFAFSRIKEVISSADFMTAALDTDVDDNKLYSIEDNSADNSPSDLVSTAYSYGIDGFAICKGRLKKAPDAVRNLPAAVFDEKGISKGKERVKYITLHDIKIAVISVAAYSDQSRTMKEVKQGGAEFVIAYCDWNEKHVPFVSEKQKSYAKQLANSGVDFIIGCGTSTLREFENIETKDGRTVGVAYSLGCITAGDLQTKYEKAGAVICLRLERSVKSSNVISVNAGYIPYTMKPFGDTYCAVLLTEKNRGLFSNSEYFAARAFAASLLGDKIKTARSEVKNKPFTLAVHGSSLLYNLFKNNENVFCDKTHLFISQFAMCGELCEPDKKHYSDSAASLYWNLAKGFDEYLELNKCDYLAVDFYYAASTPVYKMGDRLYSGGKAFLESGFYKENKKNLKTVKLTDAERTKLIEEYSAALLKHYNNKRIILVTVDDPELYEINGRFVKETDKTVDMKLVKELQTKFIAAVNPIIINISRAYPGKATPGGAFYAISKDERYFANVEKIILGIANDENMVYSYYSEYDEKLWLECIRDKFDMIKSGGRGKFFFTSDPADIVISKMSSDMISSCFEDLVRMKKGRFASFAELMKRFDFAGNKLLYNICDAVNEVRKGNITSGCVEAAIKYGMSLNDDIASGLAKFFDEKGIIAGCRLKAYDLEFYLHCAAMFEKDANRAAVSKLVRAYYDKHSPVRIDLFGGLNLPCIVQCSERLTVNKAVNERSMLTLFADRKDLDISFCEKGTAVYKELAGELPFEKKTAAKWVLIDFNEAIRKIYKHAGTYISDVQGFADSRFFEHFCKDDMPFYPYEEKNPMSGKTITAAVKKFSSYIKKIYGENIILSRMSLNYNYIDLNGRIKPFKDTQIDVKNNFIRMLEDEFIQNTDCYVIEYADKFISEHYSLRGKANTATFENLFYYSSAAAIEKIVSGKAEGKVVSDVDVLSFIERTARIKEANPDMDYALLKQICGDMAELVK